MAYPGDYNAVEEMSRCGIEGFVPTVNRIIRSAPEKPLSAKTKNQKKQGKRFPTVFLVHAETLLLMATAFVHQWKLVCAIARNATK